MNLFQDADPRTSEFDPMRKMDVRPARVFRSTITLLIIRIMIYINCMRYVFQFQVDGTTVEHSHIQVPHMLQYCSVGHVIESTGLGEHHFWDRLRHHGGSDQTS